MREKQLDFIRNSIIHVDFLAVSMTEKLTASVTVHIEGETPAVKEFGAILVTGLTELEVECLATDLPERFTVDVSGLAEISSGIYVRDVVAPANVEILSDPEEMIVVAAAMAAEEEEEVGRRTARGRRRRRARSHREGQGRRRRRRRRIIFHSFVLQRQRHMPLSFFY